MNAPVAQSAFGWTETSASTVKDFTSLRSRLLDEFFELEIAVTAWLRHLGERDALSPFGHRLSLLVQHTELEAKATPKQVRRIKELGADCERILAIRNAVVHSRWTYSTKGEQPAVLLDGVENILAGGINYAVVTLVEIEEAARSARNLAGHLKNYLNQASSPRPPSPAATIDP